MPISAPISSPSFAEGHFSPRLPPLSDQPEAPEILEENVETPEAPKPAPEPKTVSTPSKASYKAAGPSSLTIQLQRHSNPPSAQASREVSPLRGGPTPVIPEMTVMTPTDTDLPTPRQDDNLSNHQKAVSHLGRIPVPMAGTLPTDITPLLSDAALPTYLTVHPTGDNDARSDTRRAKSLSRHFRLAVGSSIDQAKTATRPGFWSSLAYRSVASIPAVFLGLLLNILDGVSYGMIMFPAGQIFDGFGPMGVSMFFMTTIIAQLVYTFGGSSFAGGNGSMMIEVVVSHK